jgi:hypothetical protein
MQDEKSYRNYRNNEDKMEVANISRTEQILGEMKQLLDLSKIVRHRAWEVHDYYLGTLTEGESKEKLKNGLSGFFSEVEQGLSNLADDLKEILGVLNRFPTK